MSELELKAQANDRLVRTGALLCVLALAAALLAVGLTFYAPGTRHEARRSAGSPATNPEFAQEADRSFRGARSDGNQQSEGADLSNNTYADVSARR